MIERAALREFQLLEMLSHPGILRAHGFTEHEVGPALIFEHDPLGVRLDHYLIQNKDKLSIDTRLELVRQIAEVISFAHDKKVVHRALCPQSILVTGLSSPRPRIKIFNWQVGYRKGTTSSGGSQAVAATSHVERLVEDVSTAYMAPEALSDDNTGEHLDVFSLGAIAYHIFSGVSPASNALELSNRLRETKGLQISSVLNGAGEALQYLVQFSTHPEVPNRTDSAVEFLRELDEVESELTSPEHDYVADPAQAQIGDLLPGGYRVVRRLGQGACSVALLVTRNGDHFVLKAANAPENNPRIKDEAEVLAKEDLRHQGIVSFVEFLEVGDRAAFLLRPVFADKDRKIIETLGQRLRKDGRLHVDLLQRFGEDLLDIVNHLEDQGIPHRDIKPDNIAVGMLGRGDKLHLVLFDFSLSRTPAENLRAGTNGYLDPLLPLRKPPRWDLHAERYAAAMTLHELATGVLPTWGDGATEPSQLSPQTEITIEPELFDASLREHLTSFFKKAFRRNINERFDNAEEMRRVWRHAFEGIGEPGKFSDHADESQLRQALARATFDTLVPELGLGTRATNALLDRANVITVEDLLTVPIRRLLRLRGVGNTTRREIASAVRILRERLGSPSTSGTKDGPESEEAGLIQGPIDPATCSIDLLTQRVLRVGIRDSDTTQRTAQALLGLDSAVPSPWPSQTEVAEALKVTRGRIGQIVAK
ncbi:MAG: protein kinase, partial [Isosphaeraceae bacterium]